MIVFAAFTPHSPLLLEKINPEKRFKAEKTLDALKTLQEELYISKPDTIILIGEHPKQYENAFSINIQDPFTFDLKEFGAFDFDQVFHPDLALADQMQRHLRKLNQPLSLTTTESLHFASFVPLKLLAENLHVKILPITYTSLSPKEHFQFGHDIKEVLARSKKRIAIIASGDLSHALNSKSPAGFQKEGELFDQKIQEIIIQRNNSQLLTIDTKITENSHQSAYQQLLILFGILEKIPVKSQILSYESPFDVGYLVSRFHLNHY